MPRFALPERVTLDEVSAMLDRAAAELRGDGAWTVDAAPLQAFDSSCLALLLELRRRAGGAGFQVTGAPQRLRALAGAYGIEFAVGEAGTAA